MQITLRFLGATRNVTGSCYLLEANGRRLMIDCGFYQERALLERNWAPFPVEPSSVDAALQTHGHLDHCGLLPKLVRDGFSGPIYATQATADICSIVMADSARIQEEDAAFKRRRHAEEGREGKFPAEPLYTARDAEAVPPLFSTVRYGQPVEIGPGLEAEFYNAGHILGSACVKVTVRQGAERRSILFSGDLGRWNQPIVHDPAPLDEADYVITESTYGDRLHGDNAEIPDTLAALAHETRRRGGNLVIPSFAIERSQELLYYLGGLTAENKIPNLMVFLDSPMAVRVTEVFKRHPELFDADTTRLLAEGRHPCEFRGLHLSRTIEESKAINNVRGSAIIIAGSGMCTGGRIKHHLVANIEREESTVLFIGFQAVGTLGRLILDGVKEVRIHGKTRVVRAAVERMNGFSAHADQSELLRWLSSLKRAPRHVFVTHGEPDAAQTYAGLVTKRTGCPASVPHYREAVVLHD